MAVRSPTKEEIVTNHKEVALITGEQIEVGDIVMIDLNIYNIWSITNWENGVITFFAVDNDGRGSHPVVRSDEFYSLMEVI